MNSATIGFRSITLFLVFETLAFTLVGSLRAEETTKNKHWSVIEIEGVKYGSSEDIETFYRFRTSTDDHEGKATFRHPKAALELDQPNQVIRINQVLIKPCLPLRLSEEGEVLVSTIDLSLAIDPILRPSKISLPKGAIAEVGVEISTMEGFHPPISTPDRSETADADIFLHLESTDGPMTLKTEILTPAWIDDEGALREKPEPLPGNEFDKLNAAMAAACHSHLIHELAIAEDLGIHRSRHPQLAEAEQPVIRMTLRTPEHYQKWSLVSKALVDAIWKFQKALHRN